MTKRNHRRFSTSILPLIIFPTLLATSFKYLFIDHLHAGLGESINALCLPSNALSTSTSNPYRRAYTLIPAIDASVPGPCAVVAFFHLLLDAPTPFPGQFLVYLLGTGLPFVLVPLVEAYRWRAEGRRRGLLRWPTVWLLMMQGVTMALTFPVYFLVVMLSKNESMGNDTRIKDDKSTRTPSGEGEDKPLRNLGIANCMTPEDANALIFGLAFGAVLPSLAMIYLNDAFATWVWQFYPLLIFGLRHIYLCFTSRRSIERNYPSSSPSPPPSSNATSTRTRTRRTLRILYLTSFALSSLTHARLIWPLLYRRDLTTLKDLVVPLPVSALAQLQSAVVHHDPGSSTLRVVNVDGSTLAHNFLKWDYFLGVSAVLVGLLWSSVDSRRQVGWLMVWYALAIPVLGAGGACMGVLAWRDLV